MPLPKPPHGVRTILDTGLTLPAISEETVALTRWFHRLLVLRTPEANDELVRTLHAITDKSAVRTGQGPRLACAKGCAYCCSTHVTVLAPEVFALARAVRGAAKHGALHDRLRGHVATQATMDLAARRLAGVGCAFLVDSACSAYARRPMTCRMFASFDVRACVAAAAGGPDAISQPQDYVTLRSLLAVITYAAMQAAGLPVAGYELNRTVSALVDAPGHEADWYGGSDPFGGGTHDALSTDVRRSIDAFVAAAGL